MMENVQENNEENAIEHLTTDEYNSIPVSYCRECLSLLVRNVQNTKLCFCDKCSSTDIGETQIEDWEKMYQNKYHINHLTSRDEIRKRKNRLQINVR